VVGEDVFGVVGGAVWEGGDAGAGDEEGTGVDWPQPSRLTISRTVINRAAKYLKNLDFKLHLFYLYAGLFSVVLYFSDSGCTGDIPPFRNY
jgi:hypothetical protein